MKNTTRGKFLKTAALASLSISTAMAATKTKTEEIFVHHVFLWLKNENSQEDRAKLLEGLEGLSKIPAIKMVHIGTPASTRRAVIDSSYTLSWLLFFDNLEGEEIYQKHPIHLKFVEDYAYLWKKVIVYDSVGLKR